jgi:hypothetical protein
MPTETAVEPLELDPEQLATCVRQLALDTHRVIKDPAATLTDYFEVSRRIEALRRQTRYSSLRELDRWLQNAEELVRSQHHLSQRMSTN